MKNTNNAQDTAVAELVALITKLREQSATTQVQMITMKEFLFDPKNLASKDRQPVCVKACKQLNVNWSIGEIKRVAGIASNTSASGEALHELLHVDELEGHVNAPLSSHSAVAVLLEHARSTSDERINLGSNVSEAEEPVTTLAPAAEEPAAPTQNTAQSQPTSEHTDMNTTTNKTEKTISFSFSGNKAELPSALNFLAQYGYATAEQRLDAFLDFLDVNATSKVVWNSLNNDNDTPVTDERIFAFFSTQQELGNLFISFITDNPYVAQMTSEEKSRWSLTGGEDSGIRTSWVAAGAAVIGGGLEMVARGEGVGVGSLVGTAVGVVGAFFAGELVDEHVESTFGRYVVGGTIGLAFGAAGSALGNMAYPGQSVADIDGQSVAPALPVGTVLVSTPVYQAPEGVSSHLAGL